MKIESRRDKNYLSKSEMFREPFCSMRIGQLLDHYHLELGSSSLDSFRHYTPQQLLEHYDIEVDLARQLMSASKTQRATLYSSLYDELYRRVPYHPQLARKSDPASRQKAVRNLMAFLERYLQPRSTFLEIGPGDCLLSFEIAKLVKMVYAVDVSEEITKNNKLPDNFKLILSDGSSVNVPHESVTVAFSNQLMEHLHPEDVPIQLREIYEALVPGGVYICMTPHRFGGPADISRFFDTVPKGLHLKEYTNSELNRLFKSVGFSRVLSLKRIAGTYVHLPLFFTLMLERAIEPLCHVKQRRIYRTFQQLLKIRLIAIK